MLLTACLGLRLDAKQGQVIFDQPILPGFLDEVVLRNLRLGKGAVDEALRREGPVRVIVTT